MLASHTVYMCPGLNPQPCWRSLHQGEGPCWHRTPCICVQGLILNPVGGACIRERGHVGKAHRVCCSVEESEIHGNAQLPGGAPQPRVWRLNMGPHQRRRIIAGGGDGRPNIHVNYIDGSRQQPPATGLRVFQCVSLLQSRVPGSH